MTKHINLLDVLGQTFNEASRKGAMRDEEEANTT